MTPLPEPAARPSPEEDVTVPDPEATASDPDPAVEAAADVPVVFSEDEPDEADPAEMGRQ